MLKLFQSGNIGRITYLGILAFIIAFDFVKEPIGDFLARTNSDLQQQVYAADAPALGAAHDEMISELRTSGDMDTVRAGVDAIIADAVVMEAKATTIGVVYMTIVAAIGLASLVLLIWMVFARVRDIAWPAAVGFGVLAPALAMRLLGAQMPEVMWTLLQFGFIGALVILGLVPTGYGHDGPRPQEAPATVPQRRVAGAAAGGFGRRGRMGVS